MKTEDLQKKALVLRLETLKALHKSGLRYLGSCMSVMEILVALYYGELFGRRVMSVDPVRPGWGAQDYLVLGKSHAAPSLYSVLADLGFFDRSELGYIGREGAMLSERPNAKIPGVVLPSLAMGHGLSEAVGLAMCLKMEREKNRVFAILGDGELQCGQVWEAAMSASHYNLNNLVVFVDNNKVQSDGAISGVMDVGSIQNKFDAFGWNVIQVRNGHDFDEILHAVERAMTSNRRPVCVWCHTVVGKGVGFAEGKEWYLNASLSEGEMNQIINQFTVN